MFFAFHTHMIVFWEKENQKNCLKHIIYLVQSCTSACFHGSYSSAFHGHIQWYSWQLVLYVQPGNLLWTSMQISCIQVTEESVVKKTCWKQCWHVMFHGLHVWKSTGCLQKHYSAQMGAHHSKLQKTTLSESHAKDFLNSHFFIPTFLCPPAWSCCWPWSWCQPAPHGSSSAGQVPQ